MTESHSQAAFGWEPPMTNLPPDWHLVSATLEGHVTADDLRRWREADKPHGERRGGQQ